MFISTQLQHTNLKTTSCTTQVRKHLPENLQEVRTGDSCLRRHGNKNLEVHVMCSSCLEGQGSELPGSSRSELVVVMLRLAPKTGKGSSQISSS